MRDFILENCHAKFGCNWTTNKGVTGGHITPSSLFNNKITRRGIGGGGGGRVGGWRRIEQKFGPEMLISFFMSILPYKMNLIKIKGSNGFFRSLLNKSVAMVK